MVIAIVAIKALGYAVSLGGGIRGEPIFPATFLGVGVGVLFTLVSSGAAVSPLATAMIRLPFTSALLALLLIGSAGIEVVPITILGAVVGAIVQQQFDELDKKDTRMN